MKVVDSSMLKLELSYKSSFSKNQDYGLGLPPSNPCFCVEDIFANIVTTDVSTHTIDVAECITHVLGL